MTTPHFKDWIGKTESLTDTLTPIPVAALSATLDRDDPPPSTGDALPPIWHWLYFLPIYRQSEVGPDGHARRGGFLPPVPLPRRMWAGSRFAFHYPLRIGDNVTRNSHIVDVTEKQGRSGSLVFVLVRHEITNAQGLALTEEHDIVYREQPKPGEQAPAFTPAPTDHAWIREITPDPVLLFRYSALTFNGHRIHYDRSYVTEVEGYPGLVVHGPLIATLLLDHLRRNLSQANVTRFAFRAIKPIFDTERLFVCGKPEGGGKTIKLWAKNAEGALCMDASAIIA